jgi:hypothetical protein
MTNGVVSVPLPELSACARLSPVEAVTIVRELAFQVTSGTVPGVPSLHVIRLSSAGTIAVEGPVAADARTVAHAAHLLDTLLPPFGAPTEVRVPGALRLIIARALGTLDLPAYAALESFADALSRFAADDPQRCIRDLVARWVRRSNSSQIASVPAVVNASVVTESDALTISDIRRARRATGLTLAEISERTRIPAQVLCELEWGYFQHWPASAAARRLMVSYARAAGLDDELVVHTAWPLLEASVQERASDIGSSVPVLVEEIPIEHAIPFEEAVLIEDDEDGNGRQEDDDLAELAIVRSLPERTSSLITIDRTARVRRSRWRNVIVAALTIPALLFIGLAPGVWHISVRDRISPFKSVGSVTPQQAPVPAAVPSSASPTPHPEVREGAAAARRPGISGDPTYSPSFASVGTAMFYQAESNGHSALMRADTDSRGSILRITSVVDDRARNFHARPSPDGTRIAFDSDRDGERGVYVADVDGRNVRRVTSEGFAAVPSWSPDGDTLAFVRAEPDHPKVWNLWTVNLTSGQTRRLTSHRFGQPWGGSWFPDGRRIAYSHEDRLVVMDLITGATRIYRSPLKATLVRTPAVSPDGTRVMFQVYREGTWLLDFRTGAMRKVLADPSAEEYTWAPDGRRVAYHSRTDGSWGVWVMGAESLTPNP